MTGLTDKVGRVLTSATTGSAANLLPRGGQILGFWANASASVTIYDSSSTSGLTALVTITACAVGWNWLPLDLTNGLTVNQSAQLYFVGA